MSDVAFGDFTNGGKLDLAKKRAHEHARTRNTHHVLIELPFGDLAAGQTYDALLEATISQHRNGGNISAADSVAGLLRWARGNQ
jgi:hypothetical protein